VEVNGVDMKLDYEPADIHGLDEPLTALLGDTTMVGYLVHDQDCQNPLESCDGEGDIYAAHRDTRADEIKKMQEALGLDSDWHPNLDHHGIERQHVDDDYIGYYVDNTNVAELVADGFVRDEAAEEKQAEGSKMAKSFWFKVKCAEWDIDRNGYGRFAKEYDAICLRHWQAGIKNGTIGNPYAVMLDVYNHGGQSYSISGEGTQCRWDTARGGALWVPNDCALENIKTICGEGATHEQLKAQAEKYCRGVIETYNKWLAGDCYGVIISYHDSVTGELQIDQLPDECWGYIGHEDALESLNDTFLSNKTFLEQNNGVHV
jgi:hypothetical protein